MPKNLAVNIAGVAFKNPVLTASGTFGHGEAYADFVDISRLGGVTVKGVSAEAWQGNETPRIAETHGGMLNAIGLQNPGVKAFLTEQLPYLKQFDTRVIVNICGHTIQEYADVAKALAGADADMLELNISCPNVTEGGMAFGTDPAMVERVTREVKQYATQPLIVKLSPNVTSITDTAKAAEAGGADAVSLINTLLGMKIDVRKRAFALKNKMGGLSGPAIKPVAVRMVYEAARAVNIPVIGMGGIMNGEDAMEFIMAGATAVAVGMASFANPRAAADVLDGLIRLMDEMGVSDINTCIKSV